MKANRILFALAVLMLGGLSLHAQEMSTAKTLNFSSFSTEKKVITPELRALTPAEFQSHPDFGVLPFNAPCDDCYELLQKRTDSYRYFVKAGSEGREFTVQSNYGRFHYRDSKGFLRNIDHRLKPVSTQPGLYEAADQPIVTRLSLPGGFASVTSGGVELKLNKNTRLYHEFSGNQTDFPLYSQSTSTVGHDGCLTKNMWANIDREQVFSEAKIKTNYILNTLPILSSHEGWMVWEDQWQLPAGFVIEREENGYETQEGYWWGELVIRDAKGNEFFRVDRPKIYDQNPNLDDRGAGMRPLEPFIAYEVVKTGDGKFTLRTRVRVTWLARPERIYPIVVDPPVSGTSTFSTGDMGFNFNPVCVSAANYCSNFMNVTMPGNSTLTGATFLAAYIGEVDGCGPGISCPTNQAGFRIVGPCGISPSATQIWTCVGGTNPGTCSTTTPQSLLNIVSCLPAQCAAWNLQFEMRTFNCTCDLGACATACHRMPNNSWIITLQGQTLALTNINTPITASATTVCVGTNVNLSTSVVYGVPPYGFVWATNPGFSPTFGTGLSQTVTPPAGTTTYYMQATDACGQTQTAQINITAVNPPTPANAGADFSVCGNTATLAGNTITTGSGLWTVVSGGSTVTTPSNPTSGVTNLATGPNTFQWTSTNSPCPATNDQVIITRVNPPTVANAGPNQSICATSANLAANTATSGTGAWSLASGPAGSTITSAGSASTSVTGLTSGTYQFVWTISNAPCTPSTDTVTITVVTPPSIATAGPDQTICAGNATLAGNTPSSGIGTWTQISGPSASITNANLENTTVTGLTAGTYVFEWSIDNAPCTPTTDQVTITVVAPPSNAFAGNDQNVCGTTANLAGSLPVIGTGNWTYVSGPIGSSITDPSLANSTITGLSPGFYVFEWTISNSPCPASSDQVMITVSEPPSVADAGPDQTLCADSTFTLAGNLPAVGNGTWTFVTGSATITDQTLNNTTVTNAGPGTYTLQWSITSGACPPSTDQVTIQIFNQPVADFLPSDTLGCIPFTVVFTNNSTGGSNYQWDFGDGGTSTTTSNAAVTYTYTTVGLFDVTLIASDGPCTDTLVLPQLIETGAAPLVSFVANPAIPASIEEGETVIFTNFTTGATSYLWDFGDSTTSTDINPTHTYNGIGEYCITLTAWDDLGCDSSVTQCTLYVESGAFFIGNVFTPNDDNINDLFGAVTTQAFVTYTFNIYDRWGELVFSATDPQSKWDGLNKNSKQCPEGVYYYFVVAYKPDGTKIEISDNVTLLR